MVIKIVQYGVGLDISKDKFHACISMVIEGGNIKVIASRKFSNTFSGFSSFCEWLSKHKKQKQIPLRIMMEVTGVYHENVLHYLHGLGYEVVLEQGKRVKRYLDLIGHKSKNDKLDGKGISEMACKNFGKTWHPISKHIIEIRTALRHRKAMIISKTRLINQLHAMKHSKYQVKEVLKSLNKMIKVCDKEIEKTKELAYNLANKDVELMDKVKMIANSVKGLGILTVLTIVAETNGFHDFSSSKQLVSYSGYDVVENQSGKFQGKTRISKKGNVHIRTNLYMASIGVISKKIKPFYGLYLRLIQRNGRIKKKAMVAVQRKLLVLIYTLWKKNEAFDMSYYTSKVEEAKLKRA